MIYKHNNRYSPYKYVVADIISTDRGILIEVLEGKEAYYTKNELLESFINSISEQYDVKYRGHNKDEFLEEVIIAKKIRLIRELEKVRFIERILYDEIRKD